MGIVESKEAVIGLMEIALELQKVFKDGIQGSDALTLYSDLTSNEEFKGKVMKAYDNVKLVPEELKDLDVSEIAELGMVLLSYLPQLVKGFKKEVVA